MKINESFISGQGLTSECPDPVSTTNDWQTGGRSWQVRVCTCTNGKLKEFHDSNPDLWRRPDDDYSIFIIGVILCISCVLFIFGVFAIGLIIIIYLFK